MSEKIKCSECGCKDKDMNYMINKNDKSIWCESCVTDYAEAIQDDWINKNFKELTEEKKENEK